ncbi:hypothetical protein D3C71_1814840 [compost metagenome]
MERDVTGARCSEIRHDAVDRFHHQVNVNRCGDAVITQRLTNHRPDGQIGNVVVIHHVEVHYVGTCGQHVGCVFTQASKICRQNGRGNQKFFHPLSPNVGFEFVIRRGVTPV